MKVKTNKMIKKIRSHKVIRERDGQSDKKKKERKGLLTSVDDPRMRS